MPTTTGLTGRATQLQHQLQQPEFTTLPSFSFPLSLTAPAHPTLRFDARVPRTTSRDSQADDSRQVLDSQAGTQIGVGQKWLSVHQVLVFPARPYLSPESRVRIREIWEEV